MRAREKNPRFFRLSGGAAPLAAEGGAAPAFRKMTLSA